MDCRNVKISLTSNASTWLAPLRRLAPYASFDLFVRFVVVYCVLCVVLKKNLIYALKSPFYSQSLNSSVLLLCVCLLCVSVVLFLCVVFFMASISLVGGLGFLKLVFLLGFMVSLFCVNVVLLLCVMFFASLILPVGWVKVSDIGFSFVLLWFLMLAFDFW